MFASIPLKVLYVGGVWPLEYSLYKESIHNPNLNIKFLLCSDSMSGAEKVIQSTPNKVCKDFEDTKNSFKPDLVLFRSWSAPMALMGTDDILWSQEIYPTVSGCPREIQSIVSVNANKVAFQNKVFSDKLNQYWLPYCVCEYWEKPVEKKTFPIMVATSIPGDVNAKVNKLKSMQCLIEPLIQYMPDKVYAFEGYGGGLQQVPYIVKNIKASFPPIVMPEFIAQAQIYISPTSILSDAGSISHKTVQAMACGVLTITMKYPGIEDIVGKDGETILYCNTKEETLEKVSYYLDHPKEADEIADNGMLHVRKLYNWEDNLKRLHAEVKSV